MSRAVHPPKRPESPGAPRRSQSERRAATRAALLAATIDSIVEVGYAATTTRRISAIAGLTVGAQQHHFATKGELVAEAVLDLAGRLAAPVLDAGPLLADTEIDRAAELIDRVWEVHHGPLFTAAIELWVAARSDEDLQASLRSLDDELNRQIDAVAAVVFPELSKLPAFSDTVRIGLATMRGLALQSLVAPAEAEELWPVVRSNLVGSLARLEETGGEA